MTNQALLPKKGKNILDSMFNQLWEYGEKGPTLELPTWCQMAIDSINAFEDSMLDAWTEVYDCWEREFLTRLWRLEVEHHVGGTDGFISCPGHLSDLLKPICVCYKVNNIFFLSENYRPFVKELCQWMVAAVEAIGIKQAAISAVMSDPTLNGNCGNDTYLCKINELREKNHKLLSKVEHAYGIYSDVNNMKNKKEYDEEIALHELQPNKYSNEDMLNMGSSVQSEAKETSLDSELCQGGIDIKELKPWNHLTLSENKVKPECLPTTGACNKFDKLIKSIANFETFFVK